jgi:hypothetical protein
VSIGQVFHAVAIGIAIGVPLDDVMAVIDMSQESRSFCINLVT